MKIGFRLLIAALVLAIGVLATLVVLNQQKNTELLGLKEQCARLDKQLRDEKANTEAHAFERIVKLTSDTNPSVRENALTLLARWKPDEAIKVLPEFLEKEMDAPCLLAALDMAGRMKVKESLPGVQHQINSKIIAVSQKASIAAGELAQYMTNDERQSCSERVVAVLEKQRLVASQATEVALVTPYIDALGMLKSIKAAPTLLQYLRSGKQTPTKRRAAFALKQLAQKSDEAALVGIWRVEADPSVRAAIEDLLLNEPFDLKVDRDRHILVPARN